MDAFAVSICKGLSVNRLRLRHVFSAALWFGGFQALMPFIGYYLGSLFSDIITTYDHWVAFILLLIIGGNMIKESFDREDTCADPSMTIKSMFLLAVATSIDALAVGISLAMAGGVNIWLSVLLIGLTTFSFSAAGVKIGSLFGAAFEKKAQLAGGLILIGLGVKILLEHLGVMA